MTNKALLSEAKTALRENNRSKAWRLLHRYVAGTPEDIEAWLMLGGLAVGESRLDYIQIAQSIAPDDDRVKQAVAWAKEQIQQELLQEIPVDEHTQPVAVKPEAELVEAVEPVHEVAQPQHPPKKTRRREKTSSRAERIPRLKIKPGVKRWTRYVGIGLFVLVMGILLIVGVSSLITGSEPEIFGRRIIIVTSGSMEPTFYTGSIIVVNTTEGQVHEVGDVITFWTSEDPEMNITHRIISSDVQDGEKVYQTKGDNNDAQDFAQIGDENIIAEYTGFTIPLLGYFFSFIKSRNGILLLAFLFGVYLIITQVFRIKELMANQGSE